MQTPEQIYRDLFEAIQKERIFPDSKTFVDCVPRKTPHEILQAYQDQREAEEFDLKSFVDHHFWPPKTYGSAYQSDPERQVEKHIRLLWDILRREADSAQEGSSLIPLPYPYIVPGGRFGEIYYWDSYFTMLGLLESGRADLARNMLANFEYLIDTVGHIPNGNRTYFISRSQPPFFTLMVEAIAKHTGDETLYQKYTPQVRMEYEFWMSGEGGGGTGAHLHMVRLSDGGVLNRYWDALDSPRSESYIEDVELAESSDRDPASLYRDLRAACESGWDFSSRWCAEPNRLDTIRTTEILPVDLNCLMWTMEHFLAGSYRSSGELEESHRFFALADARHQQIDQYFWDENTGVYKDYDFVREEQTQALTLAMLFPLFVGIATQEQAERVAENLEPFLKPGGLVTTLEHTGQQWDAPNGWSPLQWIAYQGLKSYGIDDLARTIAEHWTQNVIRVYRNTGKLLEKYDVEDISLEAGGGEYPVQDGFGWTNGVLLKMLHELKG